ncbi:MAG: hypothetical protein J5I90_20195 [Caldilineales bacterium]|nr:hypothetical protein [Caldilineales bacterium]
MTELATKAIQEQLFRQFTRFEIGALRTLLDIVGHPNSASMRRDEAIFFLINEMSGKTELRKLWDRLSTVTQNALAHSVHMTGGQYQPESVLLRYGQVPPMPQRYWSGYKPTELDLFLDEDQNILSELVPLLRVVAPKPEPWQIPPQLEPPPRYESVGFERSPGPDVGLQDYLSVLALIGQGLIQVNDRMMPSFDSIQTVLDNLVDGDFYGLAPGQDLSEAIRPVGLVRFALGSGMAEPGPRTGHNVILQLRPLGWEWLARPSADLLLDAVETWTQNDQFDELDRMTHLRGAQRPNGSRTPPGRRRDRILEALSWSPQDCWLSTEDFFKAVKLWQFDFEIDAEGELTAIDDSNGRKLDVIELRDPWRADRGAYALVILMETLASLGAIDIAYTEPQHAPPLLETPTESWQRPIHPYTRYDGMTYFRINALGSYLFGHVGRYTIPRNCTTPFFQVNESYRFEYTSQALAPYQRQTMPLLGQRDEKTGDYALNKANWLSAQQNDGTLKELRELLFSRHDGPLSPAVEDWLEECAADSTALRRGRTMITIQVRNPEVRNTILEDAELRRYCRLLDDRTLLIPSSREHAFMRRVLELGYGMVGGPAEK